MATTSKTPLVTSLNWLRPGQRFRSAEGAINGTHGELTVTRITQDRMGLTHAILRDESGREVSTYADQIQFAIEVGMLSPLEMTTVGPTC
jgi:hypothetical protein